ncbi:unnamed protein product [Rhizoctonia solani]|uniref:Uncharacterized protein n=1 Tax=Rhizoctonia solani TaxID=456999 RepID=A0A8H3B499_9AGAM|nr:unnamed protein product [Rhizoctonia solani]
MLAPTASQPNVNLSHPPLQMTSSQPTLPSSQPKRPRHAALTDLPRVLDRSSPQQPCQPRPLNPTATAAPAPTRKLTTPAPTLAHPRESSSAGRPKPPSGKKMAEEEARKTLADGRYPSGELQDEHRRLSSALWSLEMTIEPAEAKGVEQFLNKTVSIGLEDDMKRECKREQEAVDLANDTKEDEDPTRSSHGPRVSPRICVPFESPPWTTSPSLLAALSN